MKATLTGVQTRVLVLVLVIVLSAGLVGCAGRVEHGRNERGPAGLGAVSDVPAEPVEAGPLHQVEFNSDVSAWVVPPVGWKADPLKATKRHKHQVWLSPTGDTAYGVIRFDLPIPLPVEVVMMGFVSEMRRDQGEAELEYSKPDKALPGLRFLCEGGKYRVRGNMLVRGSGGWVIYAGTLRARAENPPELVTAEQAREQTVTAAHQVSRR